MHNGMYSHKVVVVCCIKLKSNALLIFTVNITHCYIIYFIMIMRAKRKHHKETFLRL